MKYSLNDLSVEEINYTLGLIGAQPVGETRRAGMLHLLPKLEDQLQAQVQAHQAANPGPTPSVAPSDAAPVDGAPDVAAAGAGA